MKKILISLFAIVSTAVAIQPFNKLTDNFIPFTAIKFPRRTIQPTFVGSLNKTTVPKYTHIVDSMVFTYATDRSLFWYNDRGLCLSKIDFTLNSVSGAWEYTKKYTYTYDAHDNKVSDTTFSWDVTSEVWQQNYRNNIGYDVKGYPMYQNGYRYNKTTELWDPISNYEFYFDTLGQPHAGINYTLNSGTQSWDSLKYEFTYDSAGNRLSQTNYLWASNIWVPHRKSEYTYDGHGMTIYSTDYSWNPPSESWNEIDKYKYTPTYNENGTCVSQINYYWNTFSQDWTIISKQEDYLSSNGSCISTSSYSWKSNAFTLASRWTYTHTDISIDNILMMDDDLRILHEETHAKNVITTWNYGVFSSVNDSVEYVATHTLYCSPLPNAPISSQTKTTQQHKVTITLTPAIITIASLNAEVQTMVSVCDLRGRTVWKSAPGTRHLVNLGRFPAGVYLLTVFAKSGKRIETVPFTKQ